MSNIVRQDVVQISFDTDLSGLTQLNKEYNAIIKNLSGGLGDEELDDVSKSSKKAADGVEDVTDELQKGTKQADKFGNELDDAANTKFSGLASGIKTVTSGLGKCLLTATKIGATALTAGAAGVGAIVAQSVSAYADYEQLVGGVETLFKNNASTVQKYANNAYKTAGLSANQYMETVTSFSASMIQSVGGDTAEAAKLSDMALTDMADNSNKLGTSMDSVIQTYQSLSRGNFAIKSNSRAA